MVGRWGPPKALPPPSIRLSRFTHKGAHDHGKVFVPIEELLLPPDHPDVVAEIEAFALLLVDTAQSSGANPRFVEPDEELAQRLPRKPRVAWKCAAGGFGCLAYTHAVPAVKVYGDGP